MLLLGTAHCESYLDVEQVASQLKEIGLSPRVDGLKIRVEYMPSEGTSYADESAMVAKIAEILEPITTHGISVVSGREAQDGK